MSVGDRITKLVEVSVDMEWWRWLIVATTLSAYMLHTLSAVYIP